MPERKPFLLRVDERVLDQVKRWADDDLRSLNAQIEFLLRESLVKAGRWKPRSEEGQDS
ncbi:MAG: Arc family DNA-binding protein [Bryobacterales bacterium]|nr:Arc family DNA-binding protein [Bryobacterales bacterium]